MTIEEAKKIEELEKDLVSTVTLKGKEYYLYADGKLYTKNSQNNLIMLDEKNKEDKKTIDTVMQMFKPGKTDVIY